MLIRRSTSLLLCFCVACALPITTSCSYMIDRMSDFSDVFSGGVGVGLGASGRITEFYRMGFQGTGTAFRFVGPKVYQIGPSGEFGATPFFHYRTVQMPGTRTSRLSVLYNTLMDAGDPEGWYRWPDNDFSPGGPWTFFPPLKEYDDHYDRRLFDIGGSLYLGVGVDFAFNPLEFVDFLFGIVTVDPLGDDRRMSK